MLCVATLLRASHLIEEVTELYRLLEVEVLCGCASNLPAFCASSEIIIMNCTDQSLFALSEQWPLCPPNH
jgi:hypothetical protein